MHGEIVGAVVAAAGVGQAGNALFIDGELCLKSAVGFNVTCAVVGNGVTAAPIAVSVIVVGEYVFKARIAGIRPLICLILGVDACAAAAIQQ